MKLRHLSIFLVIAGAAFLAAGCDGGPAAANTGIGDGVLPIGPAPSFAVEDLAKPASIVKIDDFKGKVAIVDFWATWCGPCRESIPFLQDIYNTYKSKGVEVLGITTERRPVVERFQQKTKVEYPLFLDSNEAATLSYNVRALPTLVIVDKNGDVAYSHVGGIMDDREIRAKLKELLKS